MRENNLNKKRFRTKWLVCLLLLMLLTAADSLSVLAAPKEGWVTKQGKTYYYKNGKKHKGELKRNGETYFLDRKTGVLYKGWQKNSKGQKRYYSKKDGAMRRGWSKASGKVRYFGRTNGYMYTGLKKIGGEYYYFNTKNGYRFENGFKTVAGKTYYFQDGKAKKGWITKEGKKYYFGKDYVMYKNRTATIAKKKYSFSPSGVAVRVVDRWENLLRKYEKDSSVNQLVFVQYEGGSSARVLLYNKENGKFQKLFSCQGYVGSNGINKVREGDRKTPTGTFGFSKAFGIKKDPGSVIPYIKLNPYLYWCGDPAYYNQLVDVRVQKHSCSGEHLITYRPHYNYSLAIDYNKAGVYKKGAAIFLHCTGYNPYTAGCVAVPEKYMLRILKTVDQNAKICIYPK